jgi:hypothetical protein
MVRRIYAIYEKVPENLTQFQAIFSCFCDSKREKKGKGNRRKGKTQIRQKMEKGRNEYFSSNLLFVLYLIL